MKKFFKINIAVCFIVWSAFFVTLHILALPRATTHFIWLFCNIILHILCIISAIYFYNHINTVDHLSKTKWVLCGIVSFVFVTDSLLLVLTHIWGLSIYALFIKNILSILLICITIYGLYYFIKELKVYSIFKIILRDTLIAIIPITLLMFNQLNPIFLSNFYFHNTKPTKQFEFFYFINQITVLLIGLLVLILFMASAYIIRCKRSNKILLILFLTCNLFYYLFSTIPNATSHDLFSLNAKALNIIYCVLCILAMGYNLSDKDLCDKDMLDEHIHINNFWPSIIIGFMPILFLSIYYISTYIFNANLPLKKFIRVTMLNILLIIFRDTLVRIDNKNLLSTIRENSKLDPLSKIYNRKAFSDIVENWSNPYTLFFFDLKNFKDINDIYGHNVGDASLISVAQFLKEIANTCKCETVYCRYGGDEFLFAIQSEDENDIYYLKRMFEKPHYLNDNSIYFYMNIGYSINRYNKSLLQVLKEADFAMYDSKKYPVVTAIPYNKDMEVQLFTNNILKKDFMPSLKSNDFFAVFQPKICMQTLKPIGFECLARWNNKKLGLISPDIFIPIADSTGNIVNLDFYIFTKACEFQKQLFNKQIHQQCSVNISLKTLKQVNFIETILNILKKHDLPPSIFTLEILEDIAIDKNTYIIPKINKLRELGFLISIDDFGTDYSSLNRLFQIPFDELKIPKEFVSNLENNRQIAIIDSMAYMASKLKISTVVEGIENKEQFNFFKTLGFNIIQGYYFSKPLTAEEYLDYIEEKIKPQ